MKDLLIFTVAEGRYQNYAEMWELSLSKAYPEYDTHILRLDTDNRLPRYYGACIRYLFDHLRFHEYKYLYIGDIDMMIVRESPTILEFHKKELDETGLCYSNTQRGRETMGQARLTGLHFVDNDWWWRLTFDARAKWYNRLVFGNIGHSPIDDELMLMQIVKDSGFGLPPPRRDLIERHHGLHLGTVRAHEKESHQALREAIRIRVDKDKAVKWQEIVGSYEYAKILDRIQKVDRQAYREFYLMDQFTKSIANGA